MNTIKLAGCILLDQQNRILLLYRNTAKRQQWEIPGGKVEPGESAEQAAIREIKEELGVEVKIIKLLGHKKFTEDNRSMDYTWFLAEITSGELKITEPETFENLRYFSLDELQNKSRELSSNTQNYVSFARSNAV